MKKQVFSIFIVSLGTLSVSAQPKRPLPVRPKTTQTNPDLYDVVFPGGTLESLIQMIFEQNQRPANVVLEENVKGVIVPPLQLQGVRMASLAETLDYSMGSQLDYRKADNLIAFYHRRVDAYVSIYNIQHLIEQEDPSLAYSLNDVTTAIQTAWQMYDYKQDPQMKVHEATFLIIVQATKGEHQIVHDVLSRLTKADRRTTDNVRHLKTQVGNLRSELRRLESELKALESKMKAIKEKKEALQLQEVLTPKS